MLIRWHWKKDSPEELQIQAGTDLITICGYGLRRLAEALDKGQLQAVREQGELLECIGKDALYVTAILVA